MRDANGLYTGPIIDPHHHLFDRSLDKHPWLRGATGVLFSGHSVFRVSPDADPVEATAVAEASVTFAEDVTDAELDAYVATGEPLHVAGAFTVDSLGGAFITRVEGDPSTVVGMSLSTLRRLTGELGVVWTDLWSPAVDTETTAGQ